LEADKLNGKKINDRAKGIHAILAGAQKCQQVYSERPTHARGEACGNQCIINSPDAFVLCGKK
jgi:hypothetical protein